MDIIMLNQEGDPNPVSPHGRYMQYIYFMVIDILFRVCYRLYYSHGILRVDPTWKSELKKCIFIACKEKTKVIPYNNWMHAWLRYANMPKCGNAYSGKITVSCAELIDVSPVFQVKWKVDMTYIYLFACIPAADPLHIDAAKEP